MNTSKQHSLLILALSLAFLSTSCSSYWTRKSCEKVNWFQHAHSVAMQGKRLDEDARYTECKKVETEMNDAEVDRGFKSGMAEYCLPKTAYNKGANGDGFNYEFCEGNVIPRLKAQHAKGIKYFCQPETGYLNGTKGVIYRNQCPGAKEQKFLKRYHAGRRIYLKSEIKKNKSEIRAIDRVVIDKKQEKNLLLVRLASLPKVMVVNKEKIYDSATGTYKEKSSTNEDPEIKRQREQLNSQIRNVDWDIDKKRKEQTDLRGKIHKLEAELAGISGS